MSLKPPIDPTTSLVTFASLDSRLDLVESRINRQPISLGDYSPDPTGATSSATAFTNWLAAVIASGGDGFIPAGQYYLPSGAAFTNLPENSVIVFAGGAEITHGDASSYGMTFTNCPKASIYNPRVSLRGGTSMSGGIKVGANCTRLKLYDPVVWSYITIPANYDAIVVDGTDSTYWVEIQSPRIRPNSGGLGNFRRGVSIAGVSNATQVIGGDINNCAVGVRINDSNSCVVFKTALEGCTDGIELSGTSNPGTQILYPRGESLTTFVKISQTTATNFQPPIIIHGLLPISVTTLVGNTNNVPYTSLQQGTLLLDSPGLSEAQAASARVRQRTNQGTTPLFVAQDGISDSMWWIEPNGAMQTRSAAASIPADPAAAKPAALWHSRDELDILMRYNGTTDGRVNIGTGDGAGGRNRVVTVENGYFYSTADGATRLGFSTRRWKEASIKEHIDISEMAEPAAPAANTARLFVKDNGAGKTQLMVRFPTGASQQVAIEP